MATDAQKAPGKSLDIYFGHRTFLINGINQRGEIRVSFIVTDWLQVPSVIDEKIKQYEFFAAVKIQIAKDHPAASQIPHYKINATEGCAEVAKVLSDKIQDFIDDIKQAKIEGPI